MAAKRKSVFEFMDDLHNSFEKIELVKLTASLLADKFEDDLDAWQTYVVETMTHLNTHNKHLH